VFKAYLYSLTLLFVGAFTKLRIAPVSLVMPVCPSVGYNLVTTGRKAYVVMLYIFEIYVKFKACLLIPLKTADVKRIVCIILCPKRSD
jgi:hypothetical protein